MKFITATRTLLLLAILVLTGCSVGAGGETFGVLGIGANGIEVSCPTLPNQRDMFLTGPDSIGPVFEVNLHNACEAVRVGVSGGSNAPAMARAAPMKP